MRAVVCRTPGGPEVLEVVELPDPEPLPGEVVDRCRRDRGQPGRRHAARRATTRRRRAPLTSSGWSARALSPPIGDGRRPAGSPATGSARCCPAAATPSRSPYPPGSCCHPRRPRRRPGGRPARGRLHGVVERLHDRGAPARRDVPRARRRQRHRHDGDPARQAAGRPGRLHGRVGGTRRDFCRDLGADLVVNYREQDFVEEVRRFADGGADVILDIMGASYLAPQRRRARDRGPARRDRDAGRRQRASSTSAPCSASVAPSSPRPCAPGRPPRRRRSSPAWRRTSGRWSPTAPSGRSSMRRSASTTSSRRTSWSTAAPTSARSSSP